MSFDTRINTIMDYFYNHYQSSIGQQYIDFQVMKADIINNINNFQLGHFLLTYSRTYNGSTTHDTEGMTWPAPWTRLYSYTGTVSTQELTQGAYHPVEKLKINLNLIRNMADYFPAKVLNPYNQSTMTKEAFLEKYGDYLCFDFKNYGDTFTAGQYLPGNYIESEDGHEEEGCLLIRFGDSYVPLANAWNWPAHFNDTRYYRKLSGDSLITRQSGTSSGALGLYDCYYCIDNAENTWGEKEYIYCKSIGGNNSRIFQKSIIDEILDDLKGIGIDISYLEPSLNPDVPPVPTDPEETEPGQDDNTVENVGGTGDWTINQIDKPITPGVGASLFGNTYVLNLNQLKGISNLFFSDNAISALLTHASDSEILSAFRGAMIWPFDFDDLEVPQLTSQFIKMGTLSVGDGTTTFSEINAGTTVDIDFGTLTLQNRYGGFLDYHPFTQMVIYLPFCGFKDIDPADVYGHTLHLYYLVDVESGAGKACIDVDDIPMMEYPCQLGIPISFNANNMYEKARNAVLGVVNSFTGAATMGTIDIHKDEKGKVLGIGSNPANAVTHLMGGLASTAINTAMTKTNFTSMGGVGNGVERQQPMKAYIITKTINTAVPTNYNSRFGRPSLMVKQLTEEVGKGFTTIINPQLELNCTEEEKNYIISNLENGVYL